MPKIFLPVACPDPRDLWGWRSPTTGAGQLVAGTLQGGGGGTRYQWGGRRYQYSQRNCLKSKIDNIKIEGEGVNQI